MIKMKTNIKADYGALHLARLLEVKNLANLPFHASQVRKLIITGDKSYAEYIDVYPSVNKQLRAGRVFIDLQDGNIVARKDAENMRHFMKHWEQTRRNYEHFLAEVEKLLKK